LADSYLAAIVEGSDDAIISKDMNGIITSWNPAAERIYGYTAEEIIGKSIMTLIPQDRKDEERHIMENIRKGERLDHYHTIRQRKDGELIDVSVTISPIRDREGNIIGASKIARDITEQKFAESKLRELSKRKDAFLANISHELRTPMNAVVGLANLLSLSEPLTQKQLKFVETLKVSAANMMDLINDLLDFSKIEEGKMELEELRFDLTKTVEKATVLSELKAREKHLTLTVHYAPGLHREYLGDSIRIQQVISNLISNAVKFTEHGHVEILLDGKAITPEGTLLTITVSDTGIGIAPENLAIIFEKFIQADSSITRKFGGTGLGLSIVQALAQQMGGTVRVKSTLGQGSIFTVRIPLKNAPGSDPIGIYHDLSLHQETKKNVLLVEDYAPNALVVTALLDEFGYSYDVAPNGFEAVKSFAQTQYDIVLMDIQMEGLDGLEATRRIREFEKEAGLAPTSIIAMTAHVLEKDKHLCREAGMNGFIPKPFQPRDLLDKVAQSVKGHELPANGVIH
jgi:PAS domain S-box-containing protein